MIVGCDGMLGSDVQEDNCRVCGGNGVNCNTVTGELKDQVRKKSHSVKIYEFFSYSDFT